MISREKLSNCFRVKTRENASVMDFLALDNFDFTRKIVKKKNWVKTRENAVVLDFLAVDNFDFTRKIVKIFFEYCAFVGFVRKKKPCFG